MERIEIQSDEDSQNIFDRRPIVQSADTSPKTAWRKLISLLISLVLVVVLMGEASKPENWLWMGFNRDGKLPAQKTDSASPMVPKKSGGTGSEENSDSRTLSIRMTRDESGEMEPAAAADSKPDRQPQDPSAARQETEGTKDSESPLPSESTSLVQPQDAEEATAEQRGEASSTPPGSLRAARQFWGTVFTALSNQDKRRLTSLIFDLKKGAHYDQKSAQSMLEMLDQLDAAAQSRSLTILQSLTGSDSQTADHTAEILREWNQELLPYLRGTITKDLSTMDVEQAELAVWESHIESAALSVVRDLSEVHRPEEGAAWIVNWMRLLKDPSLNFKSVTIADLNRQPEAFRGQPVTLTGTCVGIERLNLINPYLGTDTYYILWINPGDGDRNVFCTYTLKLPEGIDPPTETFAKANFDVRIKGVFHKNRSYTGSEGQIETCPLVLAEQATIIFRPVVEDSLRMPAWFLPLMGVILFTAALAALFSVYRSTQHKTYPPGRGYSRLRLGDDLDDLQNDPSIQTPQERLAEFEKRAHQDE
ncbi:MAG: hypothetical protein KF851_07700 [Pirellulaceae bacterium]|nr:hypothetical protein [Pirellulaceae bacterium]